MDILGDLKQQTTWRHFQDTWVFQPDRKYKWTTCGKYRIVENLLLQVLIAREINGKRKIFALENVEYIIYTIPAENLLKQSAQTIFWWKHKVIVFVKFLQIIRNGDASLRHINVNVQSQRIVHSISW